MRPNSRPWPFVAGPNGSGKSTFYDSALREVFPAFVNADSIAASLTQVPLESRDREAAEQAERERRRLMAANHSFAMETVFSRTSHWLKFIEDAKALGYLVWVFFLCLETPELNIARVASRVRKGGHPVPPDKIWKRWKGSLNTAVLSIPLVHELWLLDNSVTNREQRLVAIFRDGSPAFRADDLPSWAGRFFRAG